MLYVFSFKYRFSLNIFAWIVGALLARTFFQHSGKDNGCIFREIYSRNHFTEFQSTVNITWFLAFRSNGRAMGGGIQWQRRHPSISRCRQFAKIPVFRLGDDQLSRDTIRTRHGPPLGGNLFAPRRDHPVFLVRTPDEKRRRIAETEIRSSRGHRPPEVVDRTPPDGVRNEEEKITETPIARGRSRQARWRNSHCRVSSPARFYLVWSSEFRTASLADGVFYLRKVIQSIR